MFVCSCVCVCARFFLCVSMCAFSVCFTGPYSSDVCVHVCVRKQYDVMVTAGANQAFVNVILTVCDTKDSVVLFTPY
jgi:hypothetical protein